MSASGGHDVAPAGDPAPGSNDSDAIVAEQRVRALFDHSPFAIQIFAPNGQTRHVNRAYTELWGLSGEQLARFNVLDDSRLEAAGLTPLIRRGFAGEAITIPPVRYTPETTPTIQGGRAHWLRTFIYPVTDQGGRVCEVMILFEDVTAQEESYQLLEQRVAERTRELSSLLEISRNVTATLDLQTLFSLILDQIKTLIDYSGATIFSIQGHEFRILDYRGPISHDQVAQLRFPIEAALANQEVMRTRAPLIIDDVRADTPLTRAFQELADGQITTTFGYIRSWLGVPLLVQDHVIGMLTLDHDLPGHYTPRHADLALTIANQAAIAIENARLFEQAQSLAVMVERQRLARELHDSVSQALYGIALGARTARALLDRDPVAAIEPIEYVAALANAGMAEMRALIFELRPESLAEEGLVVALTKHADSLRARHQLDVQLELCEEPELPLATKEALYRIAQEALHNIVKHARASTVTLRLCAPTLEAPLLALDIGDDGGGFDPDGAFPGHLGLRSMRERAARLGGILEIDSVLGHGTQIRVRVLVSAR
ncbi:MAG: histidine kinase [Roseiflexaceae bacterium]